MSNTSNSTTSEKEWYFESIRKVRQTVAALGASSHIGTSLPGARLDELEQYVQITPAQDLQYSKWPPAFGILASIEIEKARLIDKNIDLVIANSTPGKAREIVGFLAASNADKIGTWYGGMFDVWSKCVVIRSGLSAEFDRLLPNGRDHDIMLDLDGTKLNLENTVITHDDESLEVLDRFLSDKRTDPTKVLIRPGPYCPPNAKGPSLYYDTLRVYAKVFDKVAKQLNPGKSQFPEDEKNVLLLSFCGSGVNALSPSVGWALDELFACQPRGKREGAGKDISLQAWTDFTANELIARGKISVDDYVSRFQDIFRALRRLSGVLLFDNTKLVDARLNYNSDKSSRISHAEISKLEELYRSKHHTIDAIGGTD